MSQRRPGEAPPGVDVRIPPHGRGRASVERPGPAAAQPAAAPSAPTGGRAFHRGAPSGGTRPGQEGVTGVAESLAKTQLSKSSNGSNGASNGPGSNGPNGNGNGSAPSVGRGATRGRRDRGIEIIRTRSADLENKKGTSGQEVHILSNYFRLFSKTNWRLLQYRVDFKPDEDQTFIRKMLVRDVKDRLPKYMFDGTVMFCCESLTADKSPLILTTKRKRDEQVMEITFKEVGELQPTDHHYLQFLSIILRNCLEKLELQLLGRNYYDQKAATIMKDFKLELWPGYVTAIHQHENNILLCCEVSTKVLRTDNVLDQLKECYRRDSRNFQKLAEGMLLGAIVITRYNNRTYRIDEIAWDRNVNETFDLRDGSKIDYKTYYANKYNCKINDAQQPLLVSMPKVREARGGVSGPVFLIPELCNMTGLSDEQRANFNLMKDIAKYTRQAPDKRIESLNKFSQRISNTPEIKTMLAEWNLQFSKDLEKFNARILPPEHILGGKGSKTSYQLENADWGNCFRKWSMVSVASCSKWAVIYPPRDEESTKAFVSSLIKVGPSLGLCLGNPKFVKLLDNRPATYIQQLDRVIDLGPEIVMIVIPNNKGEHYTAVKKKCYLDKPIPSQVMTGTVLGKPKGLMSVATKVAIQMNCKLGGEPWNVPIPLKGTMIVGFDTYHDSERKGTSVGAVVSSLNDHFTKYSSTVMFHKSNEEITAGMNTAMTKALRRYREANGSLPSRIIFYRDGVGDGQIEYVRDQEIGAIKQCFRENGLDGELKFTFIIVSKRINTRFFSNGNNGGRVGNPPSGTVVDDVVTLPYRYDFFLVSQSVRQGTVNPTSYNVIEDNSGLKPDHLQKLSYKLTHLYYNWPGTVRVPAPCQYAHKLAFLVGQSLHREPSEKLENLLFYL